MTATAMAGVIGAPISSAILQLHGAGGLHGWQWLFIIEGLPAVLLAPVVLRRLTERPADATSLTADERAWVTHEMGRNRSTSPACTSPCAPPHAADACRPCPRSTSASSLAFLRRELLAAADRASHWRSELGHGETIGSISRV